MSLRDAHQEPLARHAARRMRTLRAYRGWSQEQLAREVTRRGYPVKRTLLAAIESGRKRGVSVDLAVALASALDVPVMVLLGLTPCLVCRGVPRLGPACEKCGTGTPWNRYG